MKAFGLLIIFLVLQQLEGLRRRKKLLRTIPSYEKYNHNTEIQGDRYSGEQSINPSKSWERFVERNEDEEGSSLLEDFGGISTKSTGSEHFDPESTLEVVPGPRGPQGPPGILVLEQFSQTLELLKEAGGELRKSRRGRNKAGGPILNVVFSSSIGRAGSDSRSVEDGPGEEEDGRMELGSGFHANLRADILLRGLSGLQISNFAKPRVSATSFTFNTELPFDHRSGIFTAAQSSAYIISATINLQRLPEEIVEQPAFEDNITGKICLDDDCLIFALDTKIPVLHSKYASLKIDGVVRMEAGSQIFLFIDNNSGLNFKILRSSTFSGHSLGIGD